jgi:hypothetical protein
MVHQQVETDQQLHNLILKQIWSKNVDGLMPHLDKNIGIIWINLISSKVPTPQQLNNIIVKLSMLI